MIKELEVKINGHRTNYEYYKNLGYDIQYRKSCNIRVEDLMPGSLVKITSICDNCGKESTNFFRDYYNYTTGLTKEYYCNRCNKEKSKRTCLEKYGVENPMQLNEVKNKVRDTNIKKYGVDHYSKSDKFKKQYRETCLSKYESENTFQVEQFKTKIKETNLKNFGVTHYSKTDEFKSQVKKSNLEKYGVDSYSKTNDYKNKIKETLTSRYGVDNYSKTSEYKEKVKSTNLEKYGVDHYSKTEEFKGLVKKNRESLTLLRYDKLVGDEHEVISYTDNKFTLYHKVCQREFTIGRDTLYSRINIDICLCTQCYPIDFHQSYMEIEIQDFLNTLNLSYEVKNKKILNGLELDVFLPEYNLAIEMNGVYWHSEIYMEKDYHLKKTLLCRDQNIQLLHIWEDDWKYKRNIVKSIIMNRLGIIKNKIFARKCSLNIVSSKESRLFLDQNHIQGYSPSQLKLGLYYEGELVSLMTFGWRFTNGKREYELIRFCNKVETNIIGGASKLFSHFLLNNDIEEVISYADISLFDGNLYKQLKFNKISLSSPNYFWVVNGIRRHRFNYNKKKLISEGFDPKKSEVEIMHQRGYYRVFSCGQEKWTYTK